MQEKKNSVRDAYQNYLKSPELNADKLVSCLENYRDQWTSDRQQTHDMTWRQSLAFYSGNHSIRDNSPAGGYRVRVRENHTNNIINRMVSVFVQNMPIVRVFPSTINYEDVQDAEATEFYGKYVWRTKKLELNFMKYLKYGTIFGNGLIHACYDPDLGGKIELDASETKSGDSEIREYRGDSRVKILNPFQFAPRPGIEEMDDMYDCVYSEPVNKSFLESKFGSVSAEPAKGLNVYTGSVRQDEEQVMQHHYYHKGTSWFPEGLYASWAGKTLLRVRVASEHEKERLPFSHLPFDKPPLRFWAMSSIEQIMDLQEQLDRAAGMIIEARNLIARPRLFASHEAGISAQSFSDQPGSILKYKLAGGAPTAFVAPFNFAELAAHKADVRNAMGQVSGVSSASRGEIPQATRTALALQLVLEQDRSQYLPFIKTFHQSLSDTMLMLMQIAAEFFPEDDPRIVKIEGTEGSKMFHGGMVPTPLDIYLEDTNPLGWTAAGRIEQVGNLIDRGLVSEKAQALEMLHLNSPDPAFKSQKISRQAAAKENQLLLKGQMLEVMPEDIDPIHLDEHTELVMSFNFRSYPEPVQAAIMEHINAHKARLPQEQPGAQAGASPSGMPRRASPGNAASKLLSVQEPNIEGLLSQ